MDTRSLRSSKAYARLTVSTVGVINQFNDAFNRHDVLAVIALMTKDCVFDNTYPPPDGERFEVSKRKEQQMNASDILKYGHGTVLQTIEGLPESAWGTPGACGVWSIKDIIAHLASYEHVLVDVLTTFVGGGSTSYLTKFTEPGGQFNDSEVAARKDKTVSDVLGEFNDTHTQVMSLAARIPVETFRQTGTLPWYGMEYALDDFIVYTQYGHKREHSAQIAAFRDQLKA